MAKNNYRKDSKSARKGKGNRRDFKREAESCARKGAYETTNDISWYSKNPELLASVSRIPFPYKPGMHYSLSNETGHIVPGVMVLEYHHTFGNQSKFTESMNIAAKEMYGRVRAKFSGSLDADAPDLFMYTIALASVHAALANCRRIYRLINNWNPMNHNFPRTVLSALGFSGDVIDDLVTHKMEFWGRLNTLTHMANKWLVPDDLPLFNRWQWLAENVFSDEPIAASQTYVLKPAGFLMITTDAETGATKLVEQLAATAAWDDPLNVVEILLNAMHNMDESYTIQGYFERAFEGTTWLSAPIIGQDEIQTVMYDTVALSQIENATVWVNKDEFTYPSVSNVVYQLPEENRLVSSCILPVDGYAYITNTDLSDMVDGFVKPLNLHIENPTGADVVESTRLYSYCKRALVNGIEVGCGTEIVTGARIYLDVGLYYPYSTWLLLNNFRDADKPVVEYQWRGMIEAVQFNHAPTAIIRTFADNSTMNDFMGQICTMATPRKEEIGDIHRVCVYSVLNVFRQ